MKWNRLLLVAALIFSFYCSKQKKEADNSKSIDKKQPVEQTDSLPSEPASEFSVMAFIDSTPDEAQKVAAYFLKDFLVDGDYGAAVNFLCKKNKEMIEADSLMTYIIFGKDNPKWDDRTALRYKIIRRYIPVLAHFNKIKGIRKISCDTVCLIAYDVTGPLTLNKIFAAALGEDGKARFDTYIDSNVSLKQKTEFYDYAFLRLEAMVDSVEYISRLVTDTLMLIYEQGAWKVYREAQNSFEIFQQE